MPSRQPTKIDTSGFERLRQEKQELESLHRVFARLDSKKDEKIDPDEVHGYLRKTLQYTKYTKADVVDMLWEVDEDCVGALTFPAFKAMWYRLRNDATGWEPRRFFNVVEFMMHDKDGSGTIDYEETMEILFLRFGKAKLDEAVRMFTSHDEDGDACINFSEFINMDRKSDVGGTNDHPGFLVSKGIVTQTLEENDRMRKKFGLAPRERSAGP